MASSSRSHQTLKNYNHTQELNFVEEEKVLKVGQEEEKEEWLKLGLGLGSSGSSCKKIDEDHPKNPVLGSPSSLSSSPQALSSPQIALGLEFEQGSGLGAKGSKGLEGVVVMESSDFRDNLLGWSSSNLCNNNNYYGHNNDDNSTMLWPSCQIETQELPVPVPCDSHHYCATSTHQSGLWFTLSSSTNRNGEALPQLPKAFIRVRDENMTVLMVKKYLVRKLGLSNDAEFHQQMFRIGDTLFRKLGHSVLRHARFPSHG
ncbi:hypothetical protein VNO77_09702 [Canavalia gladiata]|uniref:Uncharacterized protein n=1 Tax=Canavalia gladiata TaxID=3824 RepID=A0AAN9MEY7_CANGL